LSLPPSRSSHAAAESRTLTFWYRLTETNVAFVVLLLSQLKYAVTDNSEQSCVTKFPLVL